MKKSISLNEKPSSLNNGDFCVVDRVDGIGDNLYHDSRCTDTYSPPPFNKNYLGLANLFFFSSK